MSSIIKQTPEGANSYHKCNTLVQAKDFDFLVSKINIQKSWKILDLGCGPGNNTVKLAEMIGTDGKVIGVDPIKERIEIASKKYGDIKNLEFHVGYGKEISRFDEDFDLVIASNVVHWLPHEEKLFTFQEIMKCLKPNGYFLFACPSSKDINVFKLLPMLPEEISKSISVSLHYENKGAYEAMLHDCGFEEVFIEERHEEYPFDSLEQAYESLASTLHAVNYEYTLQCLKDVSMNNNIDFMYNKHGQVVYSDNSLYGKCRRKAT